MADADGFISVRSRNTKKNMNTIVEDSMKKKKRNRDSREIKKEWKALKAEVLALKVENSALKVENSALKAEILAQKAEILAQKAEILGLVEQLYAREDEVNMLKDMNSILSESYEASTAIISQIEKKVEKLKIDGTTLLNIIVARGLA